jgi:predicted nucleotidyltransferase
MRVVGIILEANPYHFGHRLFFNQVKAQLNKEDITIALVTGYFNMRGEISLISKQDKVRLLLEEGFDLVLEFPLVQSIQSADNFARNGIKILSKFNLTDLAFGCETQNPQILDKLACFINSEEYEKASILQKENRTSFKKNFREILEKNHFSPEEISEAEKPNNVLAMRYLSEIKKVKKDIQPMFISRTSCDASLDLPKDPTSISASSVRYALREKKDVDCYLCYPSFVHKNLLEAESNYLLLLKQKAIFEEDISSAYFQMDEGLNHYILPRALSQKNYPEFITSLANKRYSKSRIQRAIFYSIFGIKEKEEKKFLSTTYLRLLGLSTKGRAYLLTLPKSIKNALFSTSKEQSKKSLTNQSIFEIEQKASFLYESLFENVTVNKEKETNTLATQDRDYGRDHYRESQFPIWKGKNI